MQNSHGIKPLARPNNLPGIITTFGDIERYIKNDKDKSPLLDPAFMRNYIVSIALPYKLQLARDTRKTISIIKCHALLADRFLTAFNEIAAHGLIWKASYFGGCFEFRQKRNGRGLSAHSWGIAIDLNPRTNLRGTTGDMAPEIVEIFQNLGFVWGGAWNGPACDPMHFQYCDGY